MDDEQLDKLCDELTPIYFYFHLLNAAENNNETENKIRLLEQLRSIKMTCDKSLINIRNILHGNI